MVEVGPSRGLRRIVIGAEPRVERYVAKTRAAIVLQKGIGVPTRLLQPRAAEDVYVEIPIVVVVGLYEVQSAVKSAKPGFLRAVAEGSVPVVAEEAQLVRQANWLRSGGASPLWQR